MNKTKIMLLWHLIPLLDPFCSYRKGMISSLPPSVIPASKVTCESHLVPISYVKKFLSHVFVLFCFTYKNLTMCSYSLFLHLMAWYKHLSDPLRRAQFTEKPHGVQG